MKTERTMLFLFNPRAGKGRAGGHLLRILETLSRAGYLVTAYPTEGPEDALRMAKEMGGQYDRVICCGGDGTLNETVCGLLLGKHAVPVGYIPAGSTNDFASSLGLPRRMAEAAQIAAEGTPFRCDVGAFNDKYFVYVAAFGAFAEVSYSTSQQAKNVLGHLAYILEGLARLPRLTSYRVRVEYDDQVIEDEFILGMVTNSLSVGGFKGLCGNEVRLNDGLFEVLLIKRPANAGQWSKLIGAVLRQDLRKGSADTLYSFTTSSLRFTSQEALSWTLDGEFGGTITEANIVNCRESLSVIVKE
jgi:diacylglycerol kinase (ATP)